MGLIRISSLLIFLLTAVSSVAQTDSVRSFGNLSGEGRTGVRATVNMVDGNNVQSLATGGYVKYVYNLKNRWEFGGALYTSFNLGITDITEVDPITGRGSRYEEGLFNVNDLDDRTVVIPGELFVRYKWKNNRFTL